MTRAIALAQPTLHDVPAEMLRSIFVLACALALILAGNPTPF
jgi:hypothetical protein